MAFWEKSREVSPDEDEIDDADSGSKRVFLDVPVGDEIEADSMEKTIFRRAMVAKPGLSEGKPNIPTAVVASRLRFFIVGVSCSRKEV